MCGGYIYPSTHTSFVEKAIRPCLHFQHLFSEREPPTHVLRPRYSIPTIRILISSLPQVAFHSNHLSTKSKSVRERVECWGDYHLKHKSKEFIINPPSITFWRVVSPRLVRCHLGAFDKIVELNQGICKGKEIAYFVKIYPSEASPSWAMAMVG